MKCFKFFITLSALVLCCSAAFASTDNKGSKSTQIDSLSYAMGVLQSEGLKEYAIQRLGVDSAYLKDFTKGIYEGACEASKKKVAFYAGVQIGQQVSNQIITGMNQELFAGDNTQSISLEKFLAGFIGNLNNEKLQISKAQAQEITQRLMQELKTKNLEKKYGANRKAGEEFLKQNATKNSVTVLPSGLQYRIITEGTGAKPTATDRVKVNYRGTLIDGTEFDSSYKRNQPATFGVGQVIKGWTEALQLMPAGSKWEIYIPQELAYGERESGKIPPFSALIFEVELLEIVK